MNQPYQIAALALFFLSGAALAQPPQIPPATNLDCPEAVLVAQPPYEPTCPCGANFSLWARGEALLWLAKGSSLPPLVTTSPAGMPQAQAGVLGAQGTATLFGGGRIDDDLRAGGRFTLGTWIDTCEPKGFEGNFFFLGETSTRFDAASNGDPILARPFFDVDQLQQDAGLVAFPGISAGAVHVHSTSSLLGAELHMRENIWCGCAFRVDGLCGYRFLYLHETLAITDDLTVTAPGANSLIGTIIHVDDGFRTRNYFNGANFGLIAETRRGPWSLELVAKLAVGGNHRDVNISGFTLSQEPGKPLVANIGGLLAQQTNIGSYSGADFALVSEFGVTLRWALSRQIQLLAGYTFLYWDSVARPGDQIDFGVNRTGIPPGPLVGSPNPAFHLHNTDYWAQGVNLGLEFRY